MKLKITKRFSLAYLGDEWKEAFIEFSPLTINDIKEKIPQIAKLETGTKDIDQGTEVLIALVSDKFVKGKVVQEDGQLVDLKKEDLGDIPVEIIGEAFSFLSASQEKSSSTQSETSLKPKDQSETPKE